MCGKNLVDANLQLVTLSAKLSSAELAGRRSYIFARNPIAMSQYQVPEWRHRWLSLVSRIDIVQSDAEVHALLAPLSASGAPRVLAFVNAHAMNLVAQSLPLYEALYSADLILRDGSGMATLFKLLELPSGLNMNGTDLIPQLIPLFNGKQIALFGTREPYLDRTRALIAQRLAPQSNVIQAHGFLDVSEYIALAQQQRPALIVLAMGMPKQEQVALLLRANLTFPCLIVCGGAIIDFLGGKTARAPLWMRKLGAEWVFRLSLEPLRLFKRYVIGVPVFLGRAVFLKVLRQTSTGI